MRFEPIDWEWDEAVNEVLEKLMTLICLGVLVAFVPVWGPFWIVGWAARAVYRVAVRGWPKL